jgi:hypothetical protein
MQSLVEQRKNPPGALTGFMNSAQGADRQAA